MDGGNMNAFRRTVGTVSMLVLSAVATGAWQGSAVAASQVTPVVSSPGTIESSKSTSTRIFLCRVKDYETMKQLAAESVIVIRGVALPETTFDEIGKIPFVATTVKVTESFRGTKTGTKIKVRQAAASSNVVIKDVIPVLQSGTEYILYLTPSGLKSKADQYSITGGAGGFQYNSDGAADRLDPVSTRLPKQITAATVRQSIKDSD